MSAPLPDALRARFQRLIEEGLSGRAAAFRLKLSRATGARWGLAIRRRGHACASPQGRPRGKGKLSRKSATSIPRTNAGTTSRLPDMSQVKSRELQGTQINLFNGF